MQNELNVIRIGVDEMAINEFKEQFQLPIEAKFCGYVICNPLEEFVQYFDDQPYLQHIGWTELPENAKVYSDVETAVAISKLIERHQTTIWGLFETNDQYLTWKLIPREEIPS